MLGKLCEDTLLLYCDGKGWGVGAMVTQPLKQKRLAK